MHRTLKLVVIFGLLWLRANKLALAANEFNTTLSSVYQITQNNTHVTQTFRLTNNFSTIYVTEYALEVGSNRLSNVKTTTTTNTPVKTKVTAHGNKTSIALEFSDKIIGKDQTREFSVSYDTLDIAIQTGKVLEVNIPKLANPNEFAKYNVEIHVPASYGPPALTTPANAAVALDETGQTRVSYQNVGQKTGISVLFGKSQTAQFSLTYHLQNPTSHKGLLTIALPPDSTYQRVYYKAIDPQPQEIHEDPDGNWLATYALDPQQKLTVTATGAVNITLSPQPHAKLLDKHPDSTYLAPAPYWEVNDPQIRKLAATLKTPKAIYDYVVKTLTYDYGRLNEQNKRLGAAATLKNPATSVCTEFTDLFIALARAAGIPAREINGFAYTQNGTLRPLSLVRDILHAWPEYWDEGTAHWVAIDPTWENTTGGIDYFSHLDFNHIVFAIHGASSETPYPAGEYKFENEETKDITVTFGDEITTSPDLIGAGVLLHASLLPEAQSPYSLRLTNNSLHAVYGVPYNVHILRNAQEIKNIPDTISLLPLSSKEIPLQIPGSNLFSTQSMVIQTQINNQVFTDNINVQSFIFQHAHILAAFSLMAGTFIIVAVLTWRLLVPRRRR